MKRNNVRGCAIASGVKGGDLRLKAQSWRGHTKDPGELFYTLKENVQKTLLKVPLVHIACIPWEITKVVLAFDKSQNVAIAEISVFTYFLAVSSNSEH